MTNRKEGRRVAGLAAAILASLALTFTACGGSDKTTSTSAQTTTAATTSTSTTAHGHKKGSKKAAHRHPRRAATVGSLGRAHTTSAKRGRSAGKRACAHLDRANALASMLKVAEKAEKRHHVAARAGMIARIKQLPKTAYQGRAAPAMAAALVATGLPVKQRAGGFVGCIEALRANG
jgi:hypothetical protein